MASEVQICNRALQKLGAKRITSLTEDSVNARACNVAYAQVRDSELRAHPWNFSITRAILPEDAIAPAFGRAHSFTLPSNFLRLLDDYPEDNYNSKDWQIEGKKIYTDDTAPLHIRYIYRATDPNEFDALFIEALSTSLAVQLCEELSQSSSKKADVGNEYQNLIEKAKKVNAIENVAAEPPDDVWITARA